MAIQGLLYGIFGMSEWQTPRAPRSRRIVFVANDYSQLTALPPNTVELTKVSSDVLPAPLVPRRRKVGVETARLALR